MCGGFGVLRAWLAQAVGLAPERGSSDEGLSPRVSEYPIVMSSPGLGLLVRCMGSDSLSGGALEVARMWRWEQRMPMKHTEAGQSRGRRSWTACLEKKLYRRKVALEEGAEQAKSGDGAGRRRWRCSEGLRAGTSNSCRVSANLSQPHASG